MKPGEDLGTEAKWHLDLSAVHRMYRIPEESKSGPISRVRLEPEIRATQIGSGASQFRFYSGLWET